MNANRRPARQRPAPGRPGAERPAPGRLSPARQRGAAPLLYLRQLPAWLLASVLVALMVAGLAVPGWAGAAALCVVAAFLCWLAFMSWPGLAVLGRVGRAAAVAGMLGLAVFQAMR